jgi:hypothetical protein
MHLWKNYKLTITPATRLQIACNSPFNPREHAPGPRESNGKATAKHRETQIIFFHFLRVLDNFKS